MKIPVEIFDEAVRNFRLGQNEKSLSQLVEIFSDSLDLSPGVEILRRNYVINFIEKMAEVYPDAVPALKNIYLRQNERLEVDPSNMNLKLTVEQVKKSLERFASD